MRSALFLGLMLAIGSFCSGSARGALTSAPSIQGSWAFKVSAGGDVIAGFCTFGVTDGKLSGTARMASGGDSFALSDVSWDGTTLAFRSMSDAAGSPDTYAVSAKLKNDRLVGTVSPSNGGSYEWTAKRVFDLTGSWTLSAQTSSGTVTGVIAIARTDGKLAGSVKIDNDPQTVSLDDVTWDNGIVTFLAQMKANNQPQMFKASGQLSGREITGTLPQPDGSSIRWSAKHAPDLAGFWKFTVQSPDGAVTGDMRFSKKGAEWTGSARRRFSVQSDALKNISWENGALAFETEIEQDGQTIALKGAAKFQGDKLTGVLTDAQGGSYAWSAVLDESE